MKIIKILFCSLLAFGCSNVTSQNTSVGDILSETKTKYKAPMVCPELTTKVCNGPDKRTVDKYPRHYCKCLNRRDVQRALEMMSTGN